MRNVLILDDHPLVRQGLRRLIEQQPDLGVSLDTESVREARESLRVRLPDAVIVDLSLRHGDGIEFVTDVRAHYPDLPILVLSMHDEAVFADRLIAAGANGYIMKQAASDRFLEALRTVMDGGLYLSNEVREARRREPQPIDALSNRELQVLQLLGRGLSSRQIADALDLSVKTVESHRQRLKHKLGLDNNAQLVRYAVDWAARLGGPPPI